MLLVIGPALGRTTFELCQFSEEQKVNLAAIEFTGYASLWWESLISQRRREGEEEITTWGLMKRLMRRKFVPELYKQDLFQRMQSLRQGGLSVADYTTEFEVLMLRSELTEPMERTIARYLEGLNREIVNLVELQQFASLDDVIQLSLKVEKQRKGRFIWG